MSTPTLFSKRFALLPLFAFLCAPLFAAGAVALAPASRKADPPLPGTTNDAVRAQEAAAWDAHTAPLLQTYCLPCHNDQKKSGGFNLAKFVSGSSKDTEMGRKILSRLRDRDMPPPGAKQPTTEEHDALQVAVSRLVTAAPVAKTPGRVLLHRLSRTEYNNSVRDVFGVTIRPADNFPADGSGGGGFDNNADTLYVPPLLMERYLEAAQTVADAAPADRVFFVKPAKNATPTQTARAILEFFAARAFRRPLETNEADPLVRLYEQAVCKGKPHQAAVRFALRAVLVSPSFLFRAEREPSGAKSAEYPLSDYEMASRLSYFLWSSVPDDRLLLLARQKKLHDPAVLDTETVRMLKSPKAAAFADGFAGQWLHVRDLYSVAQPDANKFPAWTPAVRDAAYQETIRTFQSVVQNNESLATLLDGNYTYLNHDLAQFYGINNVLGPEMRRVPLPDGRRGGVLTQASVLTLTSYPLRTSPVLRGKWVLEEILGTPAPPPPANVATLNQDDHKNKEGLTFRQRLEAHRAKPECAGCHRKMDPLGFGLENFDAIGRWRDQLDGVPVDSSGTLADGATFSGPVELKRELLKRKDDFARNVCEKMLAYALGRGIEPTDAPTVRALCEKLAQNDYRSQTLIAEIVKSYPFGYKAVETPPGSSPTKVANRVSVRR